MQIGIAIKKLRKTGGLNQVKLAECLEITQSYLSQVENCKKKPSLDLLEKMAIGFEIPLPILFWFAVEENDIKPERMEMFNYLKPTIDKMLDSLFI